MTETLHTGFPPLAAADARVLILGSMPGSRSLCAQQYYAHPRNTFWDIMEQLFGISRALDYPDRVAALVSRRIALWDVLRHCARRGSLDSAIDPASVIHNDFGDFFQYHAGIRAIFFNGQRAAALYRQHVMPELAIPARDLPRLQLPSTSPAYANADLQQKLATWKQLTAYL
ncbi:MAG: DNA-deoxyinosine glycosylase [Gammaproteobacteria bacterium]|nr:DNA-deoxyinosine glycosylase [Gammaproteobacteria bacterium]